jgi:hypothetical protein
MIGKTIQHLKANKAVGTLIIPEWPSAPFWPMLTEQESGKFISQVISIRYFPASSESFTIGHSGHPLFKEHHPKFQMIAVRLSFNVSNFSCITKSCTLIG